MTRFSESAPVSAVRAENGGAMVLLVMALCGCVLALLAVAVYPIGVVVNERTLASTAADAAALAGAQSVLDGAAEAPSGSGDPGGATAGLPAATQYALANGAQVLTYRAVVDGPVVRVTTEVQLDRSAMLEGEPARRRAVAEADLATGVARLVGTG
jgi:hypothetical protein